MSKQFHFERRRFFITVEGYRVIEGLQFEAGDWGRIKSDSSDEAIQKLRERDEDHTQHIMVIQLTPKGKYPLKIKKQEWRNLSERANRPLQHPPRQEAA